MYIFNFKKNHFMKTRLIIFGAAIILISCQKEKTTAPAPVTVAEKTDINVSYGTDGAQKMDEYLPAGRSTATTKVIILIHGGAWTQGDKADFTSYVDTLKKRIPGYAIFNINYRLSTGVANFFPTQENDVKAAIDFIYSKRTEYGISDKFVLLGASAGGHLALLQAYKYTTPVKMKAVVDFYGPTDMVDMYNNPASIFAPPAALAAVIGGTPTTNLTLYQQSSPINFVTAQSPPTIILQGGVDILVSPSQSATLNARLQTSGVVHQYVFYPTENHGWTGANLADSFDKITAFLNANVN
jgi:acetyl esterase/lipase